MNYITTTGLRTKSKEIVAKLVQNEKIYLIHRSKIIGEIVPSEDKKKVELTSENPVKLKNVIHKFRDYLPVSTKIKKFRENYENHLNTKYNGSIS